MDPTDPAQRTRFLQAANRFAVASNLLEQLNQLRSEGFTKLRLIAATDTHRGRETLWFHGKLADDLFHWISRGLLELVAKSAEAAEILINLLADPVSANDPAAVPADSTPPPAQSRTVAEGTSSTTPDSPVRWEEKESTDLVYHGKRLPEDHWIHRPGTVDISEHSRLSRVVAALRSGKRVYIQTHPFDKQSELKSPPAPAYIEVTERLLSSPKELKEYASPHYYYTLETITDPDSKATRFVAVSILRSETCMLESMPGTYLPLD